ncbi:hypothetical protein Dalk_4553 [Desulfatibacillum aliphaticivorans]|uniref:Uncharacterized protein n=1 Tax=Desulfatibacillum aliphaticivorans TaxID=218208 RepID=B8FCR8_DESAL|nr:hypothetical protein [Desulfatibacillum aliphaticivorans]ACL06231.1 hypothetical protein Dalk_4553 [Desulfatibacillum aliphaticivorans]
MKKIFSILIIMCLLPTLSFAYRSKDTINHLNTKTVNGINGAIAITEDAINVTGAVTITGATGITGNATLTGNLDYTGSLTADSGATTLSGWSAGGMGVLLVNSCEAWYSAVNSTQSTYTLTTSNSAFAAGDVLKIEVSGTVTGANAATQLQLMFGTTAACQLDKAAGAGDFTAEFTICEHTNFANQEVYGFLKSSAAADGDADHTAQTTDFSEPVSIGLDITSGHASDTIAVHSITIWLYRKN